MAYTVALVSGPNALVQNTVYAMPGKSKYVLSDVVLAVASTSGGTFAPVAATTTSGALIAGDCFVKSTTANANCVLSNQ